ncbi:hypothetical protein PM10SUCC1_02940 [Propionigenium maris DSM 9537]|uniref:Uncharacterized protein n=1 Tax=Propionigenium maris DSM 9537 TaxID=1123000 RepID=A0A9W6GJ09_9FUSO|nr:hypothetical protein [Propionigenium maris]GLI54779.1 hypothetical protein PM10SUCC1_02940 [Propionigenium maris DSM 9537]
MRIRQKAYLYYGVGKRMKLVELLNIMREYNLDLDDIFIFDK